MDGPEGSTVGASSSTRWAFVPPTPNELTPARLGNSPRAHGVRADTTTNGLVSKAIIGLGRRKWTVGGSSSWTRERTTLMTPAAPAAAVVRLHEHRPAENKC